MAREYALELNNWGEDDCIIGCKGHHPIDDYDQAIIDDEMVRDLPLGKPVHQWLKAVPHGERGTIYANATKDTKGAFPATLAYEDHDYRIDRIISAIKRGVENSEVGIFQRDLADYSNGERAVILGQLSSDNYYALCVETKLTCNKLG